MYLRLALGSFLVVALSDVPLWNFGAHVADNSCSASEPGTISHSQREISPCEPQSDRSEGRSIGIPLNQKDGLPLSNSPVDGRGESVTQSRSILPFSAQHARAVEQLTERGGIVAYNIDTDGTWHTLVVLRGHFWQRLPGHCLEKVDNLKTVILDFHRMSDRDLRSLKRIKDLTDLRVRAETITDRGTKHIAAIKSLKRLELTCPELTVTGLLTLAKLPNLEEITIYRPNHISFQQFNFAFPDPTIEGTLHSYSRDPDVPSQESAEEGKEE